MSSIRRDLNFDYILGEEPDVPSAQIRRAFLVNRFGDDVFSVPDDKLRTRLQEIYIKDGSRAALLDPRMKDLLEGSEDYKNFAEVESKKDLASDKLLATLVNKLMLDPILNPYLVGLTAKNINYLNNDETKYATPSLNKLTTPKTIMWFAKEIQNYEKEEQKATFIPELKFFTFELEKAKLSKMPLQLNDKIKDALLVLLNNPAFNSKYEISPIFKVIKTMEDLNKISQSKIRVLIENLASLHSKAVHWNLVRALMKEYIKEYTTAKLNQTPLPFYTEYGSAYFSYRKECELNKQTFKPLPLLTFSDITNSRKHFLHPFFVLEALTEGGARLICAGVDRIIDDKRSLGAVGLKGFFTTITGLTPVIVVSHLFGVATSREKWRKWQKRRKKVAPEPKPAGTEVSSAAVVGYTTRETLDKMKRPSRTASLTLETPSAFSVIPIEGKIPVSKRPSIESHLPTIRIDPLPPSSSSNPLSSTPSTSSPPSSGSPPITHFSRHLFRKELEELKPSDQSSKEDKKNIGKTKTNI